MSNKRSTKVSTHIPECNICSQTFTTRRKEVECCYCNFKSCVECCKKYYLTQQSARCMNTDCKKEYNMIYLSNNFPTSFIQKVYRKHLEDIYFKQEQALLPEAQANMMAKETHLKRIDFLFQQLYIIKCQIFEINTTYKNKAERESFIQDLNYEYNNVAKLHHIYINLETNNIWLEEDPPRSVLDTEDQEEIIRGYRTLKKGIKQHKYVARCPSKSCNGFVGDDMKCGICSIMVCPDCQQQVDSSSSHTCDESEIATAKMLKLETKPCPNCKVLIYKTDGCDQMWCVECHTAFSWTTGEKETKIHNPHYFEWLRKNGKDDVLVRLNRDANGEVNEAENVEDPFRNMNNFALGIIFVKMFKVINKEDVDSLQNMRLLNRYMCFTAETIQHYRYDNITHLVRELDEAMVMDRERFLKGEITEDKFKQKIYGVMNEKNIIRDENGIIQTFVNEMIECMNTIYELVIQMTEFGDEIYNEMKRRMFYIFEKTEKDFEVLAVAYKRTPLVFVNDTNRYILKKSKNIIHSLETRLG